MMLFFFLILLMNFITVNRNNVLNEIDIYTIHYTDTRIRYTGVFEKIVLLNSIRF